MARFPSRVQRAATKLERCSAVSARGYVVTPSVSGFPSRPRSVSAGRAVVRANFAILYEELGHAPPISLSDDQRTARPARAYLYPQETRPCPSRSLVAMTGR
jgi:hypothetical protein